MRKQVCSPTHVIHFMTAELQHSLSVTQPKAIFCQSNKVADLQEALSKVNLDARIVTFDHHEASVSLKELMDTHGTGASSAQFK